MVSQRLTYVYLVYFYFMLCTFCKYQILTSSSFYVKDVMWLIKYDDEALLYSYRSVSSKS